MILRAEAIEPGVLLRADVCIVGGGAAGITLALSLRGSGLDVLLLEAGGERAEPGSQAHYRGEVADPALHSAPDRYRQRRFGGSTTIWGGRCVPFDAIDFERRDWVPHSGWPFGRDALLPHYATASALCEAGPFSFDADAVAGGVPEMLDGFAPEHFDTATIERFSCPTDFGRRYRHRLAAQAGLRVVLGAGVTRIVMDAGGGAVRRLEVARASGAGFAVAAGRVVLATGGLEVPRLLLASRAEGGAHSEGVGNAHGLVGRFYMCHVAGTYGTVRLAPGARVFHGYVRDADGSYCRRRWALGEAAQRLQGVGGFVARLHHPRIPDPAHRTGALSGIWLARRLIRYEYGRRLSGEAPGRAAWLRHAANLAGDVPATAGFLLHWLRARTLAERKFPSVVIRPRADLFSLDLHAEQVPNPSSRVTLGQGVDALGVPVLRVDWRPDALDLRTVRVGVRLLAQDLGRSGLAALEDEVEGVEHAMLRDGAYGGHHIGTARMADDPRQGVVDADGRVHGVRNLYVAGSAVFPTSSQANPTLTVVAIAARLGAHLRAGARVLAKA
ncbi:MAG: FAD-dependent oxidoreductase [Janthinobacterium lividum]